MKPPYCAAFSASVTRPRRSSSPNAWIDASGVRSSCDTLEMKSLFNCDSRTSRDAVRTVYTVPPTSTMPSIADSPTLTMKCWRAISSAVGPWLCTATPQSRNTKSNGLVAANVPSGGGSSPFPVSGRVGRVLDLAPAVGHAHHQVGERRTP